MAARRRTTRRKTTTRRRRSPKPMLNVANAAQTMIVANAATTAFFGTRLDNFLLDGWARPAQAGAGAAGGYVGGSDNSWELSLAEIVKGIIPGGQGFGFSSPYMANAQSMGMSGFGAALSRNLQSAQGRQALATMVFAPIAFKVGKKILQKPLINPVNKGLKQLGLASVVKV
jgi:hypothetical protein